MLIHCDFTRAAPLAPVPVYEMPTDAPRTYRFDILGEGDVMSIALNGENVVRAWNDLADAARAYRESCEPQFDFMLFHNLGGREDGWLHLERLPADMAPGERHQYFDARKALRNAGSL